MIINLNITGNETVEQLQNVVGDILQQFQDEVPKKSGKAAQATQVVYGSLSSYLLASYVVNEATNKAFNENNREESIGRARGIVNLELMPFVMNSIEKAVESMFEQITRNNVQKTFFEKGL